MNWLLTRLVRYLLGSAAVAGITDDMMDGLALAIQEEAARVLAQEP